MTTFNRVVLILPDAGLVSNAELFQATVVDTPVGSSATIAVVGGDVITVIHGNQSPTTTGTVEDDATEGTTH